MGFVVIRARLVVYLAVGIFFCILPSASLAGPNADAKILLHLLAPTTKGACSRAAASPACESMVTAGDLYPVSYFAYVVVVDADSTQGVAGAQFGIEYNGTTQAGIDVHSWTNCANLEFAESGWPASSTGTLITWDTSTNCQMAQPSGPGVKAIAGYFYCTAYSADELQLIPRPSDSVAKIASCSTLEDTISVAALGSCAFSVEGASEGYNPCLPESPPESRTDDHRGPEYFLARGSSGFDPLLPEDTFPITLYIPEEKALCIKGNLFIPTSTVTLDYSPQSRSLLVNGIPAISWGVDSVEESDSDGALPQSIVWQNNFTKRYSAAEAATPEDRLTEVLAQMDSTLLDLRWPPRLVDGYLQVLFVGDDFTSLIPLELPPPSSPIEEELTADQAAATALKFGRLLLEHFANTDESFLLIAGDTGFSLMAGPSATRARALLQRVNNAEPTAGDLEETKELNLESTVAAIQLVRKGSR